MKQNNCIKPPATIGIVGGGQLGKMLAIAAAQLGYRTIVFTADANACARQVCCDSIVAEYSDEEALKKFASSVDVITFEFENIPFATLTMLEEICPVRPRPLVLRICKNRLREKTFLNDIGIKTTPFFEVNSFSDLNIAAQYIDYQGILKTNEMGYDGKGQFAINKKGDLDDLENANLEEHILEGFVHFKKEISAIVARNVDGKTAMFEIAHNVHRNHILDTSTVPANISDTARQKVRDIVAKIAVEIDVVGLIAVEMFLCENDEILVNELAPRPHNSGHYTMDACVTSQFEQHIRAICNLPLGSTELVQSCIMRNLIGEQVCDIEKYLSDSGTRIHIYNKDEIRHDRKMGHINILQKN